jgi:hypothetical protein
MVLRYGRQERSKKHFEREYKSKAYDIFGWKVGAEMGYAEVGIGLISFSSDSVSTPGGT